MANFTSVAEQLGNADASRVVHDSDTLTAAVAALLNDPQTRASMTAAATAVADANAEVVDRVMEHLQSCIDSLPAEEPDARP